MLHTQIKIVEHGDPPPFPELASRPTHLAPFDRFSILQGGMDSGRASVAISAELPDGSVVFIQTSARNFYAMAMAVRGACERWGEDCT